MWFSSLMLVASPTHVQLDHITSRIQYWNCKMKLKHGHHLAELVDEGVEGFIWGAWVWCRILSLQSIFVFYMICLAIVTNIDDIKQAVLVVGRLGGGSSLLIILFYFVRRGLHGTTLTTHTSNILRSLPLWIKQGWRVQYGVPMFCSTTLSYCHSNANLAS